jgi:hypothetical protein
MSLQTRAIKGNYCCWLILMEFGQMVSGHDMEKGATAITSNIVFNTTN